MPHNRLQTLVERIEAAGNTPVTIRACDLAELQMIAEDFALYVADWIEVLQESDPDTDIREESRLLGRYIDWDMADRKRRNPTADSTGPVPWPSA